MSVHERRCLQHDRACLHEPWVTALMAQSAYFAGINNQYTCICGCDTPPPRTAWVCWILLLIKLGYFTCSRGSPQVLRDGQKGVFFVVGIFRECSSPNTCGKHQEHHSVSNENRVVYPREGPACRPSLKCHVTFITLVLI